MGLHFKVFLESENPGTPLHTAGVRGGVGLPGIQTAVPETPPSIDRRQTWGYIWGMGEGARGPQPAAVFQLAKFSVAEG